MNTGQTLYQLPPEIEDFKDVARKFVRDELIPMEQAYLKPPKQGYGLQPITNLRAVFLPA